MEKEDVLILAIESSCDETAAAVVKNGRTEPLRGPIYMGVPSQAKAKELIREYYLGGRA